METILYVVSRQTTKSGTATDIAKVKGVDFDDAMLNAKIKSYDLMKAYKNEASMIDCFVGVSDLGKFGFYLTETWERPIEPQKVVTTDDIVAKLIADGKLSQSDIDTAKASLEEKAE